MSRDSLYNLAEELRPYIQGKATNMRSPVGVVKQVACTLYYLSDEGRLRKTANAFGLSLQVVSKIVQKVCKAITVHLGPRQHLLDYCKISHSKIKMAKSFSENPRPEQLQTRCFICLGEESPLQRTNCCKQLIHFESCFKEWFRRQLRKREVVCPHCKQPIPTDTLRSLNLHFRPSAASGRWQSAEKWVPDTVQEWDETTGYCKDPTFMTGHRILYTNALPFNESIRLPSV
ncbi:hypothetical protein AWC38_SpisGene12392 [Stylophora pistillata]|uniref:RING-type domain-containing protein n=1 Tax=Stylophora pistillata TaxID=50429 RepID=A0A2B4S1Y4_STYPI|nr:hypothetical protein AWC38_SpisGene12392 [Stylophora pistillata]